MSAPEGTRHLAAELLRDALAGGEPVPGPHLVVVGGPSGGARAALRDGLVIGRGGGAAVRIPSAEVSRVHARVVARGGDGFAIEDAGSKNGVAVNGAPLGARPRPLFDGDVIDLGAATLRVRGAAARPAPSSPRTRPFDRRFVPRLAAAALLLVAAALLAAAAA